MPAYLKGIEITGPRGPAGPDGNPIGTVISYMGTKAPGDYLICDGTAYNIEDWPQLAEFFQEQFGKSNYFGGDGTATFAVPDMRNLFLRGYHGSATALSGNIGVKQEGTKHVYVGSADGGDIYITGPEGKRVDPENIDSAYTVRNSIFKAGWQSGEHEGTPASHYTARPVNIAVLFCIKAV